MANDNHGSLSETLGVTQKSVAAIIATDDAEERISAVTPRSSAPARLMESSGSWAEQVWGIRWEDSFPAEVAQGITVHAVSYHEAQPFIHERYPEIFGGEDTPFNPEATSVHKERYLSAAADFFLFRKDARDVGIFIGNLRDWSTYYVRALALGKEIQGQAAYLEFWRIILNVLRTAGVRRADTHVAPSNWRSFAAVTKCGFSVSGTVLSDRWGALTQLTQFLAADAEDVYLDQFCSYGRTHREQRHAVAHHTLNHRRENSP